MNRKIERFNKKDINQIANVMREAFNSINQEWSESESLEYIKEYFNKSANFVVKENQNILGFVIADKHSDHLFIDTIGVLPSEMNKGLAKILWNKIIEYCKQEHIKEIKMIADPKSIAYQWYKKLQFNETGWVELSLKLPNTNLDS